jgi:hypothetical protein
MRRPIVIVASFLAPLVAAVGVIAAVPQPAAGAVATYKLSYAALPNGTSRLIRWNGCQSAITWKVNLAAVPTSVRSAVLGDTKWAVSKISGATGITFSYKGSTTEVPQPGSMGRQTAEVIIAFTSPTKTTYDLSGGVLGQGGFAYSWASRTLNGVTTYYLAAQRGFVVIDTPQMLSQTIGGAGTGKRRSNMLLHELGHVMALQHVSDTRQQMYPTLRTTSPSGLAFGDLAGLAKVGRKAGCINTAYLAYKDLS